MAIELSVLSIFKGYRYGKGCMGMGGCMENILKDCGTGFYKTFILLPFWKKRALC